MVNHYSPTRQFSNCKRQVYCGSSSAVERRLPKPDVAGSIPVSRSILSNNDVYIRCSTTLSVVFPATVTVTVCVT